MEVLNRNTAQAVRYPEKVIQFGEGNFLRAFVDWIIWNTNQKTDFNAGVVVVQPIKKGMVDVLNSQDGLYHVNLQGIDKGEAVDSIQMIDVVSRGLDPYADFDGYMALAENPDIRFVISNTTEAGIAFDPDCRLEDKPASSYPGKLTQLLYHRYEHFKGDPAKGLIILPCELIFLNGKELKKCIYQYIELWQLGEEFKTWFEEACGVYCTLVDRIVPGYPKDTIEQIHERIGYKDNLVVKGIEDAWTRMISDGKEDGIIAARVEEWMVFSKKFLYLDQTRFRYQISVTTGDGAVNITVTQVSYLYSEEWEENKPTGKGGEIYRAEEWITDEHALNKKGTKVLPQSGKFRRKTIDRIEEIFENAMDMFETKVKEKKAKENKEEKVQKRQFVVE